MNLEPIIRHLINSGREGSYWDFKEEPHANKALLLHDVICLANSLHKGDRYLILGVTDPNSGVKVKGLIANQKDRKTQSQYIDFLRTKKFAGDNRPVVEVHTVVVDNLEIDVLIIFDQPSKPYYLTEEYKDRLANQREVVVRANYIYARTNDTNTPIDKSADISFIEKMWRQRFGLDLPPLERMENMLMKPDEWFKDIGNKPYAFHKDFPEFRIEFSDVNEFWETFSFFFTSERSFLGNATFKYHATTLFELEYMFCDEMRIELAVPDTEMLELKDQEEWYYYFDLSTLKGKLFYFLSDGLTRLSSRGASAPFVIFKNDQQRIEFNAYVKNNECFLENVQTRFHGNYARKRMDQEKKGSVIDPVFIDKVLQLHDQWVRTTAVY